jgi:hypothetical protein
VVDGKIVLHEIKGPTPTTRYAVGNIFTIPEEGAKGELQSGVFVLERAEFTPEQHALAEERRAAKRLLAAESPHRVLAEDLEEWLATAPADATREVNVGLVRPEDYTPLFTRLERAIALGFVKTYADKDRVRGQLMAEQRALVEREQDRLLAMLGISADAVKGRCSTSFCISLEVTPPLLERLIREQQVRRVDALHTLVNNELRGREIEAGTQLRQFLDIGHDGWLSTGAKVKVGVIEHSRFNVYHPGFLNSGGGASRIASKRLCLGGSCSNVTDYGSLSPENSRHATLVAGLVAGDLMDGQDSFVLSWDNRRDRSGYAREASLYLWRTPQDGNIDEGLSDVGSYDIPVLSMSIEDNDGDWLCSGGTILSSIVNDNFDSGTVTFFAAGNDGHLSTSDCKVDNPGSAIGAFVVGGHTTDFETNTESSVRYGGVWSDSSDVGSSRGGTSVEGKRTIIDVTAPACRKLMFDGNGGYTSSGCGTSEAAPTAAGAAVDFITWYKDERNDFIDDPGVLTSNMLLMGDRATEVLGVKANVEFSDLYGAGRLKMRIFGEAGLDGPAQSGDFWTCIDHGEILYVDINNGNPVSSDVDALKFVSFVFDRTHEDDLECLADLDLQLQRSSDGVNWSYVSPITSNSRNDEKERVFYGDFSGGYRWRVAVFGIDVQADNTSCGTNSVKTHFAWFFEDSDREAAEDLDDIDVED